MPDLAAAIATIESCKDTHQQWIDHLTECPNCPHAEIAGEMEHHVSINAQYANVLAVLRASQTSVPPADDIAIDPDCIAGKHRNCTGTSWNRTRDEPCPCPCACHDAEANR